MTAPEKKRPSLPSVTDDTQSAVRERTTSAATSRPPESAAAPRARLEAKLRTARALLGSMPAVDERARLLHVAIVRRDEALLDGVLASLGVRPTNPPER